MVVAGIGLFIGLVIALIVISNISERKHMTRLRAYAAHLGWHPFGPPAPQPVEAAARSRCTKLALAGRGGGDLVWMVWHQWTEQSGSGSHTSSSTHDLTRYYLWLGPTYPNMRVCRRTTVGAFFKKVRGLGTGDPEFDRRYVVKPTDRHEPLRLLTPMLRQALMAGQVGTWEISAGTLIQAYRIAPEDADLQPRADHLAYLAQMLR